MGLSESCEEGFKHLLEYIKRHGDARVPHSYVAEKHRLGGWVRKQRSRNARRTLDPDRKRRLEMLPGWIWDTNVDQWEDGSVRLLEYVDRHGDARVPRAHEVDGYRLGAWVNNTRNRRANGIPERQERLEKLPGWSWDPHTDKWEKGFKYLPGGVHRASWGRACSHRTRSREVQPRLVGENPATALHPRRAQRRPR